MLAMLTRVQLFALCFASSKAAAHYGDPNSPQGCRIGEVVVNLKGISGNFCSPPCVFDVCPHDVPPNVTATPTCDVDIAGVKLCSLKCSPNGGSQCGRNASCKSISGTGVCSYDDTPPPPSSLHWAPVNSPSFASLTTAMTVGFTKDGRVGFSGAGQDGKGAEIVRSTDSGLTWAPSDGTVSLDIFLTTAVRNATSIIVTGASHNAYSTDGVHFHPSTNLRFAATPSAGVLPGSNLFATPYATESASGVGTSPDGRTWAKHLLTGLDPTYFQARYGSFPSACTW